VAAAGVAARFGAPEPVNAQDATPTAAGAEGGLPNFLILWGDDVGPWNISAYSRGMMGYQTPNIDRIGDEGALYQSWYGENSCTAGRSAFLTGQSVIRTGLSQVGLPGAKEGLQPEDVTFVQLLKPLGYATGQFGKNHLGDRNEFLPTVHGFDEFYGNLYHLNAEQEPEDPDYPQDPAFKARYGTRGVLHVFATEEDDATEDPKWGRVGKQRIEDTGPLTIERMQTVDYDITDKADFIRRAHDDDTPFFVWWNSTRMHIWTHLRPEAEGVTGLGIEADGMVEHDGHVGQLLDLLDELGVADNTIVMYSTDNGPEVFTWPDGGMTPFRGQKTQPYEGGYRVPALFRWPGVIAPGSISNDIHAHLDLFPTFMAAVGQPDIKAQLLDGVTVGDTTFKVHLDGYNLLPYWAGEAAENPRHEFFYWIRSGDLGALRFDRWKLLFLEPRLQDVESYGVITQPMTVLDSPKVFDILGDPFERADRDSISYGEFLLHKLYLLVPAQEYVGAFLATFADFPPRQKAGSFGIDQVMDKLQTADAGS
jgi:arylsulfatase